MIVYYSSSTVYSILPVLVTTLIPVIHCALHLMIFSICGLYPSYLIIILNSNCDNRVIPHLLTISILRNIPIVKCWLVVELGTPREQRPGTTVERSKGESERTKRKGRELHLVSFVSNPSINFTS